MFFQIFNDRSLFGGKINTNTLNIIMKHICITGLLAFNTGLYFKFGSANIPHKSKRATGGEDAWVA